MVSTAMSIVHPRREWQYVLMVVVVLEYTKRCYVDLYSPKVYWDVAMVCLASGWCFVLKFGVKYVTWQLTEERETICNNQLSQLHNR